MDMRGLHGWLNTNDGHGLEGACDVMVTNDVHGLAVCDVVVTDDVHDALHVEEMRSALQTAQGQAKASANAAAKASSRKRSRGEYPTRPARPAQSAPGQSAAAQPA